ncbi:membrane protease subunit HflK [Rhodobacteraceae bacterium MBR-64]|jgi:membrane protease subunit HflK
MTGKSGGPWGSGGGGGNNGGNNNGGGGRGPGGEGPQIPEIDQLVKKGQEQLRVLLGGRGNGPGGRGPGGGGGQNPMFTRGGLILGGLAVVVLWVFASVYTVRPEERSVELLFGRYLQTGQPGLNFAPWPVVKAEIVQVTGERTADIGQSGSGRSDAGLMLTRDEAVVDIAFQVVWNISDPARFLFNLGDAAETVRAVAESSMRDIIARSNLSPILNRDRGAIADELRESTQATLQSYEAGVNIIRINFDRADPPQEVINSFREVQAARQERDRLQREADAYANRVLAGARGEAAQVTEEAEGYRAQAVNAADGEASRFNAVYEEYAKAPEVTRRRMYLETMEKVLGGMNKIILEGDAANGSGSGVVPYLPLNELIRGAGSNRDARAAGAPAPTNITGSSN